MRPLVVRVRHTARSCAAGASYGCGVSWWCCYGVVYTDAAVFVCGATWLTCTVLACACWICGGKP